MKRVLIFSLAYNPFIGGAEVAVKEITDRIHPEDIEFTMITLRFDATLPVFEKVGNIAVHRIGFTRTKPTMADLVRFPLMLNKYLFPFLALRKAKQLQREKPFDGIWSIMANYAGFGALFFKKKFPDVPFILTLQEGDPIAHIKRRVRFVYPWFVQIFSRADIVQTISRYLADFAKHMGYSGPLEVIPNAVNVRLFTRPVQGAELQELKEELGKKSEDIFLTTTSRLVRKNGIEDVIRALPQLPNSVHFLVIGTGPDEQKLRELAEKLKVSERTHFLGHVDHADIPKYLHISDIFIRPSLSEGMGNSFIEAMAAKVPVIATPVGGIVDFLFDPEKNPGKEPTGIFCKVQDPRSIVEAVTLLMGDAALRERIKENGYRLVSENYDWDLIAKKMYDQVFTKLR